MSNPPRGVIKIRNEGSFWGIYVCQPTGTQVVVRRGTPGRYKYNEVSIEDVRVGDRVICYNGSASPVVESVHERDYEGSLVRVETESGFVSKYTPEHICLASRGSSSSIVYCVYLMKRGNQFRIGRSRFGGGKSITRLGEEEADSLWILYTSFDQEDCCLQEWKLSYLYGLPERVFRMGRGQGKLQERLDQYWKEVGPTTTERGLKCLADHGLFLQYPDLPCSSDDRLTYSPLSSSHLGRIRAANLRTGMSVQVRTGSMNSLGENHRETITVSTEEYKGKVYSLGVSSPHIYVADGIFTHNCKTDEFIVSKRMGDIKKVLFDHLKVTSMVRPEVLLVLADEEYDRKISDLRVQANSSLVYEEGKTPEIVEVVTRFALQEIPIEIVAGFFNISEKQINELMRKDD